MMSDRLKGKTAVVTGAGSGMGRVIAQLFASEGAQIAVLDVSEDSMRETVSLIEADGGVARAYQADISNAASVEHVRQQIVADFGQVTTLINNAGIFDNNSSLTETDEAVWDRVIAVDLKGIFLMCKAFMPHLQDAHNATIVNTASIAGLVANGGGIAYTAAKHGVIGVTKSIAADYGPAVRVNAVCPGLVRTPQTEYIWADGFGAESKVAFLATTPAKRHAECEEIARAVLFLASADSSFVYGHSLLVDGGWTVS
ncbi:SDR family oxidoreductase [Nesterenkonia sp. CL21]|uniref:SDR family NAD(P)-dependent oxidoreductase n=1 Tax=Nesterenkonia sp. CL21 TaxID=3064894 RepID=UPI00287A1935|nr:SDR family oxidoreductase [Nesterenkonia sp. CL21]MDS2171851.1 SDR family oxidoreductase [Nesterenkonia sp. CL21]